MTVHDAVRMMQEEGARLAEPVPVDGMPAMTFACSFAPQGVAPDQLAALPFGCPVDLAGFWAISSSARLFEDQQYGQWGLEIFAPEQAITATRRFQERRARDFIAGDVVIGAFLGDSDLLLVRSDPTRDDFGHVVVALPLDTRADWYIVARSFAEFLSAYAVTGGDKFWTKAGGTT